ncbi:unnamed protein product [Phytophthora fragariaefolia]|uniref:Unnamed protein product n=1 Tax=Phytophthora fragariaefolia TaxID=1490495 RepID=A0A9W7D6V8_9STRA|nr:unnamed protein product [Phytophthora fragariaefolia]
MRRRRTEFADPATTRLSGITVNAKRTSLLIWLNGYARTVKIQYEKGGADAADHMERFLLNCGDDGIMDLLYSLQLADIQRVEQIINKKILGEKSKKQRDRLVASRVGEARRNDDPQRRDISRRSDIRRDHRGGRRGEPHESRRDDLRSRRDDNRERRVTVADATVDDLYRGATQLPVVATAKITAQLAEMIEASTNAPTTEITEVTTVRGVPMIAENNAVTRPSDPVMVLVQHAEAAGTQHTSAIGGANSASRCMMRGAARRSSAWRSSPSSSAPTSTSREILNSAARQH